MIEAQSLIGVSPFEHPDVGLVVALARCGALGVLDLGHSVAVALNALGQAARRIKNGFGVRIPEHFDFTQLTLPANARVVVVPASLARFAWDGRTVLAEVRTIEEARAAVAGGAHGLIVKGHEAAGLVAEETTFVLLQRVRAESDLPVWAQGGIGLHSGAACIAGGARGVVLDAQLALLEDAATSPELRRAIASMDGSETVLAGGYRLYARPNALAAAPDDDAAAIAQKLGATDPARELVTMGQDAAFAAPFAQKFATVERLVRGLHAAFAGHLRQARALRPLARHAPLAQAFKTTFPIAQGPMTRVSDRAAFAEDTASAGGLPFIALSLMRGGEARALLEETKTRLAGKSWGVGVLGFLPADVREEQLALLTEIRPPVAIIAGGRPAQAKPLEDVGIATFLHVPSPGLLDLFLKEGARRFVFEGRECGGHVGPRSSLVLWDAAVERLLLRPHLRDVEILFAGGIHDARSACMVAALAAPLAARGAKVGVLMGTAYLFTEEAVRSGAIQPAFQEEAIRCDRTALLSTAPGHSTRCADTAFVRTFERERERLTAEGADAQATWIALEQLNLGRLRLAAKGLRREGEVLATADVDAQRSEGMFMIGQIAALRNKRCTIDELHREVCDAYVAQLEEIIVPVAPATSEMRSVDIAIVGMACLFPDAPDLETYFANIVLGRNAIREVRKERWDPAIYFDPAGTGEKTPSKWGGFLAPTLFDPGAYGIPPRSLAAIDPVQILSLEVARRALADAGCDERPFDRDRASVVFGAEAGTDLANAYGFRGSFAQFVGEMPAALDQQLPKLTEDSFPGVLSNVIAGRIANRLDLRGVNYTVDAACASSLAAVDVACKELAMGASDLVVAGGADLHNGIHDYLMFASVHALSPTGQSRPFDAKADGIALGEGIAAVVLKRLEDAERDGDRIYAVIKGLGGSSDGKSLGLTAPRKEGQIRALERAYVRGGISAADVGLVEAHGTGTVVGDRTELATLTEFFGAAGALAGSCTLGSVKSQIGHTKCAAGMAGVIKAALALHRGVLPPTRNVTAPNPAHDTETSPFVLRDVATPWTTEKRLAAVSAFGFGGTNFHVVLSSHGEPPRAGLVAWPAELFVARGHTRADAMKLLDAALAIAKTEQPPSLRDLAFSVARENAGAPPQLAIVASSLDDLRAKIGALRTEQPMAGAHVVAPAGGKVAFLFPGQGSQRPNMISDLFVAFPEIRELLELGKDFQRRLFPGSAYTPETRTARDRAMMDTRVAQPTLGIVDLAVARLFERAGVRPDMTAGHSYGELVALAVASAFDAETLVALSRERARCILDAAGADPGTMAAVRGTAARVREILADEPDVVIANHNAPDQVVIAGSTSAIIRACERLAAASVAAKQIPVACAFHSPLVARARESFATELESAEIFGPTIPVYANSTAASYSASADAVRFTLAQQIAMPVRFVEEVDAMYEDGARVFLEVGPGGVLTDLVGRILKGRPHVAISTDKSDGPGVTGFVTALARLVAAGVPVNVEALFEGRAKVVDLSDPARFAAPMTAWLVDGGNARPLHGEPPDFAMKPLQGPLGLTHDAAPRADAERETTVREYLHAMRELVDAQRTVMMRYLGDTSAVEAVVARGAVLDAAPKPKALPAGPPSADVTVRSVAAASASQTPIELLIATVSERTGYPSDMLDLDLDLEADLGIDSIKRIEILGEMRDKLGQSSGGAPSDELLERLVSVKSLRGIVTLLDGGAAAAPSGPASEPEPSSTTIVGVPASGEVLPPASGVTRYIMEVGSVPPASSRGAVIAGRKFALVGEGQGVGTELAILLARSGAEARHFAPGAPLGEIDGLIYLETLAPNSPTAVRALFAHAQEAVKGNARWVVAATALGGHFGLTENAGGWSAEGSGVAGMLKSIAKERPQVHVRAVDLDPRDGPKTLAANIFAELIADDAHVEIGYVGGERHELVVAARPSSIPPPSPIDIDRRSVVLFTGGARGITAQVAIATAKRFGCAIELVGRSPLPDRREDEELSSALDAPSLRRRLVERMNGGGPLNPAAIEAQTKQILAAREIRATLQAIESAGGRVGYHSVDVRDEAAFGAIIDQVRSKHGKVDGVVHGAGLVEDKLLHDKSPESFDRVYATKVLGAQTLAKKLADEVRFFVLFSSVSGAFGNRGQTDYAAANDALDKLAHHLHRTVRGRVLSINWGPWRGAGMVRPELEREYERRGVALIDPVDGIERFFEELLFGSEPQVILTAAKADALA